MLWWPRRPRWCRRRSILRTCTFSGRCASRRSGGALGGACRYFLVCLCVCVCVRQCRYVCVCVALVEGPGAVVAKTATVVPEAFDTEDVHIFRPLRFQTLRWGAGGRVLPLCVCV
jgi:hypothetical protein